MAAQGCYSRSCKQLSSILAQERTNQKSLGRSTHTALWKQICDELNIPLRLLLAIRDPQEVMVSLMNRDRAYTGMDAWRAQQLWWRHNAQVFMDRGSMPLQVVSYSNWFDPDTVDLQLQQLAPSCSPLQHEQAKAAIRPKHRRSHRQQQPVALHASVKAMYERLHAAALEPEPGPAMLQWIKQHNPPPKNHTLSIPVENFGTPSQFQQVIGRSFAGLNVVVVDDRGGVVRQHRPRGLMSWAWQVGGML